MHAARHTDRSESSNTKLIPMNSFVTQNTHHLQPVSLHLFIYFTRANKKKKELCETRAWEICYVLACWCVQMNLIEYCIRRCAQSKSLNDWRDSCALGFSGIRWRWLLPFLSAMRFCVGNDAVGKKATYIFSYQIRRSSFLFDRRAASVHAPLSCISHMHKYINYINLIFFYLEKKKKRFLGHTTHNAATVWTCIANSASAFGTSTCGDAYMRSANASGSFACWQRNLFIRFNRICANKKSWENHNNADGVYLLSGEWITITRNNNCDDAMLACVLFFFVGN